MSIYKAWSEATANRDADGMAACLHDDYQFVRHQSGMTMNKEQMSEMLRNFMASDRVVVHSHRCLYENDEVMIEHSVMDFADGTKEAIIAFYRLQDGKIVYAETGATPITS